MESDSSSSKKSDSIFLQIVEHPDGSITRPFSPLAPPLGEQEDPSPPTRVKDVPLDPAKNTYLRLYLPRTAGKPLPVVIFLHGGGFVLFGPDSLFYHNFCRSLSLSLPALVVSASYRLAPETPLPAAYHDVLEAIRFVRSRGSAADPWLVDHGDMSRFYLMGSSSGANIAYRAALHASTKTSGLVLNQPYFGGVRRTKSEAASEEDPVLPLRASDMMWRLALPAGADRDHEYCDPTGKPPGGTGRLPRCLVKGSGGDPLVDRQREFAGMLEGAGVEVVKSFDGDGCHAAELFDPAKAAELFAEVREFVYGTVD